MNSPRETALLFALLCVLCGQAVAAIPGAGGWQHQELRRFKAEEANLGVAVNSEFFYAIDNHALGKYRKDTGARVAGWEGGKGGRIQHLNAGVVFKGRLYCAHSNFPKLPEQSSVADGGRDVDGFAQLVPHDQLVGFAGLNHECHSVVVDEIDQSVADTSEAWLRPILSDQRSSPVLAGRQFAWP